MTLKVDPEELTSFARRTEDLSGQCMRAADHVEQWLTLDASDVGVIFQPVLSQVNDMRDVLVANLDSLRRLTEGSAQNLADAASSYREQEPANAARLAAVGNGLS
ncbi:type VII secretion target [Rhodococcus marinonascens]|uniref:type VII secretion target n=1 Tax=Rhodococcus marinonascens TaxID=38311 RepID=UPI0009333415|nr:type VII secretion target [Rhodococcus marinonascens]